ncbi:hypothetical protein QN277_005118 [Acacia crassicarpa]|nr:hypothetical protein QN277_005118 [Acacia crassicarpa]
MSIKKLFDFTVRLLFIFPVSFFDGGDEEESEEGDVDSEIAVHLKRLAKKDPTTKLKALASLSVLLKQKSVKDIVPIFPQWAFEYKKLLLDYNREVRRVAFKLSKRKPDDNLQILHSILFGKQAKDKHRAKVKEKLDKCVKEKLVDFCDVLNIPISKGSVKKEELSAKLSEFLESPHATTDVLLTDKEQKDKKRKSKATPSKSSTEASIANKA